MRRAKSLMRNKIILYEVKVVSRQLWDIFMIVPINSHSLLVQLVYTAFCVFYYINIASIKMKIRIIDTIIIKIFLKHTIILKIEHIIIVVILIIIIMLFFSSF